MPIPEDAVVVSLADDTLLDRIESSLMVAAKGRDRFEREIPLLLRQALDEVIDPARSGRFTLAELEKTELTYIGTKVEILIRDFLKLPHGNILDLLVDGVEVDVKNTVRNTWEIPKEAIDQPCLVIRTDERSALCWVGLIVARSFYLRPGKNQDKKRSVSSSGRKAIRWLLEAVSYPRNFWEDVSPAQRTAIMSHSGGTSRVAALFREFQNQKIDRKVIEAVGQQRDPMKRIRKNGGARDILAPEGIAVLWGKNDRALIAALGLPSCTDDEFISVTPTSSEDVALLRRHQHLD